MSKCFPRRQLSDALGVRMGTPVADKVIIHSWVTTIYLEHPYCKVLPLYLIILHNQIHFVNDCPVIFAVYSISLVVTEPQSPEE